MRKPFSFQIAIPLVLCLVSGLSMAQQRPGAAAQSRMVTVNVRNGFPVRGAFVKADEKGVEVEPPNGRRLTINMDDVISLIFVDDMARLKAGAGRTARETESATRAIKALRGLAAATEVGVNNRDYGARLIDAKIAIEESLEGLADSGLKKEIVASLEDYTYASTVWDAVLLAARQEPNRANFIFPTDYMYKPITTRYPSITFTDYGGEKILTKSDVFDEVWGAARKHMEKASALLSNR